MQKQILNIPHIAGNELPDKVHWLAFDEDELLVQQGWSNLAHSQTTPRGHQFTTYVDYDTQLSPGVYTIQFVVEFGTQSHTTEIKYEVEVPEEYNNTDVITIDRNVSLNGNYKIYSGNLLVASGSELELPAIVEPRLEPLYAMSTERNVYDDLRIWFVNPSIMNAVKDMRSVLDRLNRQLRLDSLEHTDQDYLLWLQMGRDRLNTLLNTSFTMTEATGSIRDLWLVASQIYCIRTRYLEEGLTSFSYSGAAVQLDIDVTQYLEAFASQLEDRLSNEAPMLKAKLHNQGTTTGSGAIGNQQASRVASALGITAGLVTSRYHR